MKQRRRSRLRSCRAESCAGALDATGGVTHPRHGRGQCRRRWCGERSSRETRWVPSPAVVVRLLEERTFTPPRAVEVQHEGSWCPGFQRAWRLCDDNRGWVADVEYVAQHDCRPGKHLACISPDRLRLPRRSGDTAP